jgi:hypothetical protein
MQRIFNEFILPDGSHHIPLPKEFSHKQKPDSKQKKKRKKNKSQNIRVSGGRPHGDTA